MGESARSGGKRLRDVLGRRGGVALGLLVLVVAPFTALGLWEAFDSLMFSGHAFAGIDLQLRLRETTRWWAGESIYRTVGHAVYPPAAYLLFKPLFVFTEFADVRRIWGLWCLLLLIALAWGSVRAAGLQGLSGRAFAVLLPLALSGTAGGIGNGQVSLLCTVFGVGAVLLACRDDASWGSDVACAALFIVALIKPTMTAPLFWVICFLPGRWRPALLIMVGYVVATVLASLALDDGPLLLLALWTDRAVEGARYGATDGGSVNMQTALGVAKLSLHAPLVVLGLVGALGAWVAGRPSRDPWILMGVAGIVARLAFYHRTYDDLIVLPALVALARVAQRPARGRVPTDLLALALAGLTWGVMLLQEAQWLDPGLRDGLTWLCWIACGVLLVAVAALETPEAAPG